MLDTLGYIMRLTSVSCKIMIMRHGPDITLIMLTEMTSNPFVSFQFLTQKELGYSLKKIVLIWNALRLWAAVSEFPFVWQQRIAQTCAVLKPRCKFCIFL